VHPIPLIRVQTARALLDFRARAGLAGDREPTLLGNDEALIPLAYVARLMDATARATGDGALGLHLAHGCRIDRIPIVAHLLGSWTLGQALEGLVHWGPVFNPGERFRLRTHGDLASVERWMSPVLQAGRQVVNDFSLAVLIDFIRLWAGARWRPLEIHAEGPAPRHAEALAAEAEHAIHFGEHSTRVIFRRSVLRRLPGGRLPTGRPGSVVGALPAPDFAGSVRQTVRALLALGELDLATLAQAAGSSVRSLQRRLAEIGTSFAGLVDEARFDAAARMLRDPDARVADVSAELGYTDSANFTRAFRRWAGVPPAEFRRASLPAFPAGAK
jgi:AraC-like DNA-binding protein